MPDHDTDPCFVPPLPPRTRPRPAAEAATASSQPDPAAVSDDFLVQARREGAGWHPWMLFCQALHAARVRHDRETATQWLELAAGFGHLLALPVAGNLWLNRDCSPTGTVSDADRAEAHRWYARARREMPRPACAGDSQCALVLGDLHRLGLGGPRDLQKAAAWYRQGIDTGDCDECRARLGRLFRDGAVSPAGYEEHAACMRALADGADQTPEAREEAWLMLAPPEMPADAAQPRTPCSTPPTRRSRPGRPPGRRRRGR
jgi:hypothetical protein